MESSFIFSTIMSHRKGKIVLCKECLIYTKQHVTRDVNLPELKNLTFPGLIFTYFESKHYALVMFLQFYFKTFATMQRIFFISKINCSLQLKNFIFTYFVVCTLFFI